MSEIKEMFSNRHIGLTENDKNYLLKKVGYNTMDDFIGDLVPNNIKRQSPMEINSELSEKELLNKIKGYASLNVNNVSMIGQGFYGTHVPSVILRNVLENPSWYTAYTPYQPEISQGRLEALLNFQTMVSEITALPIANASMLDESTAAAEAMTMSFKLNSKKNKVILDKYLHPQTINVIKTRAEPLGIELIISEEPENEDLTDCSSVIFQYPNTEGKIKDFKNEIKKIQEAGTMVILVADLLSLSLIKSPGELGADIAVGTTQRFGVPMGFGGPHAAYFATQEKFSRKMPGRLVGVSQDKTGLKAYRLALQTREQHIRREKATSNICTAQALLAIMAGLYGIWHGPDGLKKIASRINKYASHFASLANQSGFVVRHENFFDTIVLETGNKTEDYILSALKEGINVRKLDNAISLSFDELTDDQTIEKLKNIFKIESISKPVESFEIKNSQKRNTPLLEHSIFSSITSETEMLRYIRHLSDRDLALDRTMIPLGSCTMKLNAATEMIPVTWPEFSNIHPFAPEDQTLGYRKLIDELEHWLCTLTGYDGISLQPNAGSQGEFAGLMAIRQFHKANGEQNRDICLIPSSAHGTNPASAIMAGMKVVVVSCDKNGDIDIDDLNKKAKENSANLAAMMITYPSTHGVFEKEIKTACEIIHDNGGQVYVDGANLNALIGLVSLTEIGADVSHLNLHKTFCIPHGGGGPGIGPVAVKKHLIPFLPNNTLSGNNAISATTFGSAGILPISWSYIAMMGEHGLREATKTAVLSANYVAKRLSAYYPILFSDDKGLVAHECILDINQITSETNISNEDIAKRLIDYGFHAPTMSWPVPNTLMVEPTESEPISELDRFCNAMISISKEIEEVKNGNWSKEDNPLKNSPHTVETLTQENWNHPYSRQIALANLSEKTNKYFPPVGRIDNVYGDRNLVCSCPPMEAYELEKT
ncbi:MAG: glycine dehydrogenase (aminomethyl-transferring) [SAR116 cluster bacterium]|nr:glycine dehydrogenase (aminomethyl-transferring) [SAR116 cluster bacterium]